MKLVTAFLLMVSLSMSIASNQKPRPRPASDPDLAKKIARFSPTVLTADISQLSPGDRKALTKIIAAAKLLDPLFLRQVWGGNEALKQKLEADKTPAGRQRLHYFLMNDGPWSRLDHNEPFIAGVPQVKPPHANYYPDDMTKQEFETWIAGLSAAEKQKLKAQRVSKPKKIKAPASRRWVPPTFIAVGLLGGERRRAGDSELSLGRSGRRTGGALPRRARAVAPVRPGGRPRGASLRAGHAAARAGAAVWAARRDRAAAVR